MSTGRRSPDDLTDQGQRLVLGRAVRSLAAAGDFDETLRRTIAACLPELGDFGFFDVVVQEGEVRRTAAAHQAPDIEAMLAPTRWVHNVHPELNLCALSTGEPALHPATDDAWYRRIAADDAHLRVLRELAFRSMLTVPMRWRGELLGALTLFMGRSGRHHGRAHLAFAAELAELAAPLVANARLLERHLRVEAELRASENRLRTAVDAGRVGIWEWDIADDRVTWSDQVYQLHGLTPGAYEPGGVEAWRKLVVPEDLPRVEAAMQAALDGGAEYAVEFRTPLPDGRVRWIAARSHLVRDASGRPLRMVGASSDVTERVELLAAERRARSESEAARRRMELLASAGEVLARSLDTEETLQAVAHTIVPGIADWCRIDLLDEHGVLQRKLAHHTDPERSRAALEMARRLHASPDTAGAMAWVVRTGQAHHGDYLDDLAPEGPADPAIAEYIRAFGLRGHFVLPLIARGRTLGAMAVLQAESGRVLGEDDRALVQELGRRAALALDNARLFAEAAAARRQAEQANRAKDEFLAMLGHELRNPLAPIGNALELMDRRHPDVATGERRIIARQVRHLSRLIDDLLDISRITRGKIDLQRSAVDLKAVLAHALELTRPLYGAEREAVQVEIPGSPAVVQGEFVRLAQVFANLLINAAKFTPPSGRVQLRLADAGVHWQVVVADTGCGIAPDLLPRVFDLFVQGRQSIDRRSGGLGLGLAIVRSLVELHGGGVTVDSAGEGQGATFTVWLPKAAGKPPATQPEPARHAMPGRGRLLVVDDNQDAALTLAELLELVGYQVRTAGDAGEAVAVFDEFQPQLALLDIGLPQVDGYQLAGMLRDRARSPLRLVALTGYGQEADRARAMAARFDEHLVKPVDTDQLTAALARLLG